MLIPDRLWPLMTEEEQALVRAVVKDGARHAVDVVCPECAHAFAVRLMLTAKIHSTDIAHSDPRSPEPMKPETPDDRLLDAAERSGILAAFATTCERLKAGNRPKDIRTFFLNWIHRRQRYQGNPPPPIAVLLREALDEQNAYFELWQANGVVGVVTHDLLRMFVPYDYIKGFSGGGLKISTESELKVWVRGRFGYVPVDTPVFQAALRERSIGEFARLNQ
jgi:hypothetical protein